METTGTPTPEELLDAGRRTIDRKALQKTIKDIFSYRNPLRQFMENYRFNVIRWSATNLRKPSLWKRAGLFFNTGGIPGILRENFRQNRADLLARWERGVIGDINRSLIRLGSIPLSSKPRDLSRQLKDISRKIYRMTTYDRKYSINSLVYWVTYVHNVVYSFYRSMIYCYINSTQRCAGSIVIDIIPTNGADKRKFFPFAPYFPVTNVIKRYFYPYFPAIIGIKGYSFPYFPYLSGIMKIKTALYSLFSRLDWHKTVVFPCLGEIYEGIRSLSWEIPVT